jgi:SAM-dependent methyltransferase
VSALAAAPPATVTTAPPATVTTAPPAATQLVVRADTGGVVVLDLDRWDRPASGEEQALLTGVQGPVIDLGCGPGRLVVDLAARRVPVLGIDLSPDAVDLARRRGATVLQRDLFGDLPDEGRWATVLLFDGNIGIGGDPVRLLRRCRRLTARTGRLLVEVGPPGVGWRRASAWLVRDGRRSAAFPWAVVGADAVVGLGRAAGLTVTSLHETISGRCFAGMQTVRS